MDIYNPDYYRKGKIEVADFIEDKGFNFFLGNVVKYVSRAGMKEGNSAVQDLKKAQWYLNKEIARLENLEVSDCCKKHKPSSKISGSGGCCTVEYMSDDDYADACATLTSIIFGDRDDDDDFPYPESDFEWDDRDGSETYRTVTHIPRERKRGKRNKNE